MAARKHQKALSRATSYVYCSEQRSVVHRESFVPGSHCYLFTPRAIMWTVCIFLLTVSLCEKPADAAAIEKRVTSGFQNPPKEYRPKFRYWYVQSTSDLRRNRRLTTRKVA